MSKMNRTASMSIRMEPDLLDQLKAIAEHEGRTVADVIRRVCRQYVESQRPPGS